MSQILLKKISQTIGLQARVSKKIEGLRSYLLREESLRILLSLETKSSPGILKLASCARGQLWQDLFVLSQLKFLRQGYFVEVGATNGIDGSNTYLLEKKFSWKGIVVEPAQIWHKALTRNRSCHVSKKAVWAQSGQKLRFREARIPELSTLEQFAGSDFHSPLRLVRRAYVVESISLGDLLRESKAPRHIDYLSIDTEGSEFEILRSFDFAEYTFGVITVEHNHRDDRKDIKNLLESNGYQRVLEDVSSFDDWYISKALS